MGDKEVFSIPQDDSDEQERERRIQEAFTSLRNKTGKPLSEEEERRIRNIHEAVASGDKKAAEEHLSTVRQESSWLYEELMKHPEISAILRELSIMGF